MNSSGRKLFTWICLVVFPAFAFPVPLPDDAVTDYLLDVPNKEIVLVKRRTFEDMADRQLKHISLSSLVGDLENNIFASALSLNKVFTDTKVIVPDVKAEDNFEHDSDKNQHSFTGEDRRIAESTAQVIMKTTESSILPATNKVILEAAEKVAQSNGEPTHIVIDRIAIEPHKEGVALIPTFELKQSGMKENANRDQEITKTSTSKTEITTSATATTDFSSVSLEGALESTSTPKDIENLKEAEKELKEKVAEIEAEPIILSARV